MKKVSRIAGQILQVDYDRVLSLSDEECCYSLSEKEVAIILSQTDYFGWKTRWKSVSETEIDQDIIDALQSGLERKLMTGCCPDDNAIHRYLPDGTYQTSDDGGDTWVDDPTGDPRYNAIEAPPLPGSDTDGKRCAAADNVRDQYKVMRDHTIDLLTAGTTLLAIVAGLVGIIAFILSISIVGTTFGVILFGLSAALLSMTPEEVATQIDDTVLESFRCIIYCHMDNSGHIDVGALDDILTDIQSTFSGFPETFFYSITASMQSTGINNAATMGVATADDCSDCDCPVECGDESLVTIGTVLSSGVDENGRKFLNIQSNTFSTFQNVSIGQYGEASPPNTCCHIFGWGIISGSVNSSGYTDCSGGVHDPGNPETHDCGHATWNTAPGDGTPFVISVTFGI